MASTYELKCVSKSRIIEHVHHSHMLSIVLSMNSKVKHYVIFCKVTQNYDINMHYSQCCLTQGHVQHVVEGFTTVFCQ